MSLHGRSLLDVDQLTQNEVELLFSKAKTYQTSFPIQKINRVIAMMFFETSTRTSMSFQMAAHRLGYRVIDFNASNSSMKKGETLFYTLKTLEAMKPDLFVIRHGGSESLKDLASSLSIPIINAGEGKGSHPTQALLDAFTIQTFAGNLSGQKILIVGDVAHSRVAKSNRVLLEKMGAEVGYCCPDELNTPELKGLQRFETLKSGLEWATVAMALRFQLERHETKLNLEKWIEDFRFTKKRFQGWRQEGLIMHPGPFNLGVEIDEEILSDSRCKIFDQKSNGVFIRAALMNMILEGNS
jgi:aspartate carbamoyltransferase catalytic subunit